MTSIDPPLPTDTPHLPQPAPPSLCQIPCQLSLSAPFSVLIPLLSLMPLSAHCVSSSSPCYLFLLPHNPIISFVKSPCQCRLSNLPRHHAFHASPVHVPLQTSPRNGLIPLPAHPSFPHYPVIPLVTSPSSVPPLNLPCHHPFQVSPDHAPVTPPGNTSSTLFLLLLIAPITAWSRSAWRRSAA